MAKTYPELLGEWVKRRESTKRDKNLVAFLAVRDDVRDAVKAGYAVKTIWANMYEEKRVTFGYDTFLNYVNRHIRRPEKGPADNTPSRPVHQPVNAPGRQGPKFEPDAAGPQVKKPDVGRGFTFNSAPRKEDLL
jgi:hypothetical protein